MGDAGQEGVPGTKQKWLLRPRRAEFVGLGGEGDQIAGEAAFLRASG